MDINKVYDADVFDFLERLDLFSIDLAVVDPPYNMNKGDWDKFNSDKEYFDFTKKWLDLLIPRIKMTGSLYIFNNAYNSAIILEYLSHKNLFFRNWITWYKKDGFSSTKKKYVNSQETLLYYNMSKQFTFNCDDIRLPYLSTDRIIHAQKKGIIKNGKRWYPNEKGRLCNDVWEITSQRHKEKINGKVHSLNHPTVKPYEMIERIIKASSNEQDLVLDLFSGSGMTSIVSKSLNRNYIGCENNSDYLDLMESEGIEIGRL